MAYLKQGSLLRGYQELQVPEDDALGNDMRRKLSELTVTIARLELSSAGSASVTLAAAASLKELSYREEVLGRALQQKYVESVVVPPEYRERYEVEIESEISSRLEEEGNRKRNGKLSTNPPAETNSTQQDTKAQRKADGISEVVMRKGPTPFRLGSHESYVISNARIVGYKPPLEGRRRLVSRTLAIIHDPPHHRPPSPTTPIATISELPYQLHRLGQRSLDSSPSPFAVNRIPPNPPLRYAPHRIGQYPAGYDLSQDPFARHTMSTPLTPSAPLATPPAKKARLTPAIDPPAELDKRKGQERNRSDPLLLGTSTTVPANHSRRTPYPSTASNRPLPKPRPQKLPNSASSGAVSFSHSKVPPSGSGRDRLTTVTELPSTASLSSSIFSNNVALSSVLDSKSPRMGVVTGSSPQAITLRAVDAATPSTGNVAHSGSDDSDSESEDVDLEGGKEGKLELTRDNRFGIKSIAGQEKKLRILGATKVDLTPEPEICKGTTFKPKNKSRIAHSCGREKSRNAGDRMKHRLIVRDCVLLAESLFDGCCRDCIKWYNEMRRADLSLLERLHEMAKNALKSDPATLGDYSKEDRVKLRGKIDREQRFVTTVVEMLDDGLPRSGDEMLAKSIPDYELKPRLEKIVAEGRVCAATGQPLDLIGFSERSLSLDRMYFDPETGKTRPYTDEQQVLHLLQRSINFGKSTSSPAQWITILASFTLVHENVALSKIVVAKAGLFTSTLPPHLASSAPSTICTDTEALAVLDKQLDAYKDNGTLVWESSHHKFNLKEYEMRRRKDTGRTEGARSVSVVNGKADFRVNRHEWGKNGLAEFMLRCHGIDFVTGCVTDPNVVLQRVSLDRLFNNGNYNHDNVIFISLAINLVKAQMPCFSSAEQFEAHRAEFYPKYSKLSHKEMACVVLRGAIQGFPAGKVWEGDEIEE